MFLFSGIGGTVEIPAKYLEEFFEVLLVDEWHTDSAFEHHLGGGIRLTTRRVNRIRSSTLRCLCVHVDQLDFSHQPPVSSMETILIPKHHAQDIANHDELLLTMTRCSEPVPDETPTVMYYGVTSWGPPETIMSRKGVWLKMSQKRC